MTTVGIVIAFSRAIFTMGTSASARACRTLIPESIIKSLSRFMNLCLLVSSRNGFCLTSISFSALTMTGKIDSISSPSWAYGVVVSMFDFYCSDRGSNPGRGGKIS